MALKFRRPGVSIRTPSVTYSSKQRLTLEFAAIDLDTARTQSFVNIEELPWCLDDQQMSKLCTVLQVCGQDWDGSAIVARSNACLCMIIWTMSLKDGSKDNVIAQYCMPGWSTK